jgi:competence protein ComEC
MRHAAALPACAALIGAAGGVCLPWPPWIWWLALLTGWTCAAATLWRTRAATQDSNPQAPTWCLIVSITCGFVGAGGVLGAWDAARARRPSLLTELARLDLDPTTCGGQQPAALLHSCDIVANLEGTLRNDAAASDFGVTFTLDVERIHVAGDYANAGRTPVRSAAADATPADASTVARSVADAAEAVRSRVQATGDLLADRAVRSVDPVDSVHSGVREARGAVRVTVGGQSATARMASWRAGRRIRAPVSLRAPLPYRNVGVPDQRDRLALAGINLFGSIKSATLVHLVSPASPWQERAADLRAWARHALTKHVRTATRVGTGADATATVTDAAASAGAGADAGAGSAGDASAGPGSGSASGADAGPDPGRDLGLRLGAGERPPASASPGQSAAIAIAVLIGDRAGLSPDVERRLQRAGTYHVIAISGGNIAILTALLLAALRLLPMPPPLRLALAAAAVLLYAIVIDAGPSVIRATMAAVAYLLTRAIDVEARSLEILSAIVFLMLLSAPLDIVDAGFWLTCGATLGILLHAGPTLQHLRLRLRCASASPASPAGPVGPARPTRSARSVRSQAEATLVTACRRGSAAIGWALLSLIVTTLFAELVLLPITAFTFSQITLAGLLLNIAAIPLMTVAQLAGMTTLAADASTTLAGATGWIAHLAATGLVRSANLVDLAPWMAVRVPPPPLWLVFAYFASWVALWTAPPASRLMSSSASTALAFIGVAAAWTACLALIVIAPPLPAFPWPRAAAAGSAACEPLPIPPAWRQRPRIALTMIDVGQGGAALVQADDGSALLVDAGGTMSDAFDIGARVVSPALWALGIRRLDALGLTHGDIDHIGGAPAIVDDFSPRELWRAIQPADEATDDHRLKTIATKARTRGAAVRTLASGDHVSLGHASIRVWNPPPAAPAAPLALGASVAPGSPTAPSAPVASGSPVIPVTPARQTASATAPSRGRLRNNESLVLDVRLGDVSIVLPGDIGADVERRLARDSDVASARQPGQPLPRSVATTPAAHSRTNLAAAAAGAPAGADGTAPPRLRILAAPHHGSRTSSSAIFLDAFPPSVVLISAGLNNRHGHPSPATLDRYRARGIPVFRTDLDGAIQVLTDGAAILVSTCSGRRASFGPAAARSP